MSKACTGDSGGPLSVVYNGVVVQIGIVSSSTAAVEPFCSGGKFHGKFGFVMGQGSMESIRGYPLFIVGLVHVGHVVGLVE